MALPFPIAPNQTDAKSPIDQLLMDSIRLDLDDLDSRLLLSAGADFSYRINGNLDLLNLISQPQNGLGLDAAFIAQERSLTVASVYLDNMGAGGPLEVNVRRLKYLSRPISGIQNIFTANIDSIARGSSALLTQSITKSDADLATQSVTYAKAALNIDNIIQVTGSFLFRINFTGTDLLDEDYQVGKFVNVAGATDAGNNGTFEIKAVNVDNGKNIVVENALGAAQISAGGSVQLNLVAYTFLASAPDNFAAGEDAVFIGHIDASNDGTFTIYKTNAGGNNILVYRNAALVEQVGAGGQVEVLRFSYNFLTPVNDAFVIGEEAVFSGHVDLVNDGSFEIKAKNYNGGDNLIIYNAAGLTQAIVQGQVLTNRFVYALDADPEGYFIVGDNAIMAGNTNVENNGTFQVVQVKYLATNNVVIYNPNGIEDLAAIGTIDHAQKAITFREDFSADFEADKSSVEIIGTPNALNDGTFLVLDINRTAISPYNIICELSGPIQNGDAGQVYSEVRSIFANGSALIEITQDKQVETFTVLNGDLITDPLENNTIMLLDILQAPSGSANLAVNVK